MTFHSSSQDVKLLSRVRLFVTPWTVAYQAPLSMGFPRQEYWSGLPCPPPGDLPNPGFERRSSSLQEDSLLSEPPGKPCDLCGSGTAVSDSLWPHGLHSPWNSPGQITGVVCHALLQGIFPTQGSKLHLLDLCIVGPLSHLESPTFSILVVIWWAFSLKASILF